MARILVIDDEDNIRMMVRMALQHAGHKVATAVDGADGLDQFGDGREWDLVLLDERMPGMNGMAVLHEMRKRDPEAKIIMITAFGTVDLAVQAIKSGATDFLRKPFTTDVLRAAAKAVAERDQAPASDSDATLAPISFGMTTLNGFRIESHPGPGERKSGDIRHVFTVQSPEGESRDCSVLLPAYVIELVKAHADRDHISNGDRFWQAFCEEALASYVWRHAAFPPDDSLSLDNLTTDLRRWIDVVLSANK